MGVWSRISRIGWMGRIGRTGGGLRGAIAAVAVASAICMALAGAASEGPPCARNRDIALLARFVQGEAGDQPLVCRVAVASVILNRVDSPKYPNSIAGVIYQQGAFRSVPSGRLDSQPDRLSRQAACMAVTGIDPSGGALKFWDPRRTVTRIRWQRRVTSVLGGFFFGE